MLYWFYRSCKNIKETTKKKRNMAQFIRLYDEWNPYGDCNRSAKDEAILEYLRAEFGREQTQKEIKGEYDNTDYANID